MPSPWPPPNRHPDAMQWDEMWDGVPYIPLPTTRTQQDLEMDLLIFLKTQWGKPNGFRVNQQVNLTTPRDEANWLHNYRIPDIVLLTPDRFSIDKNEYMVGPPSAVVEIRCPGDGTYDKLPFYAKLGVPEVWVIHRDTKVPTVFALSGGQYQPVPAAADGWVRSGLGIELRPARPSRLGVRLAANPATAAELPEG